MYHNNIAEKSSTRIHHAPGGRSQMASLLSGGSDDVKQSTAPRRPSPFATDADSSTRPSAQERYQSNQDAPGGRSQMASLLSGGSDDVVKQSSAPRRPSPFGTDADEPKRAAPGQQQQQQQYQQQSSSSSQSAQERYQANQAQAEPVGRRVPLNQKQSSTPWGTDADLPAPAKSAPRVQAPWGTNNDAPYTSAPRQDSRAQEQAQAQGSTLHQGSNNPSVKLHAPAGGKSSMSSIMNWGH